MVETQTLTIIECGICGANLELDSNVEIHELIDCTDCGTDYEVTSISPLSVIEAPMEAEDWGQ